MENFIRRAVVNKPVGCTMFHPVIGHELLEESQIAEISDYITAISVSFKGVVKAFKDRTDCRK